MHIPFNFITVCQQPLAPLLFAGVATVTFTETDYVDSEGSGRLEALIIKDGENTENITLKVTPLTYQEFVDTYSMLPPEHTTDLPDPAECKL